MKKQLLVSSILLTTPAVALSAPELSVLKAKAHAAQKDLVSESFITPKSYASKKWVQDAVTKDWVEVANEVQFRLIFKKSGIKGADYFYDSNCEMDYEVLVEQIDIKTGEKFSLDNTYYAKKSKDSKIKLFNCNSTANCRDDGATTLMSIKTVENSAVLSFENTAELLPELAATQAVFVMEKK